MSMRPIKTWSYPGALLDALVDTRTVVGHVEFPIPTATQTDARDLVRTILDQLDHHLIPRVREQASPAIVVVGGSTGAGKSTVVNALLGEQLTPSGVLRPTTKVPHLFHHPLDTHVLTDIAQLANVVATEAVPRGLAIVDSPDIDSIRADNRQVALLLLEAADLWIFMTTPARYGDSIPWEALRRGAERGAAIAVVLNRVTVDTAAHVRRELVGRLAAEGLDNLPLFVIPEDTASRGDVPHDVVGGLGRWLDSVASSSAAAIVERTLFGAAESLKEWLERLAEYMDEQSWAAKDVRAVVRRCAADALNADDEWHASIPSGAASTHWETATADGGALFKLRNTPWGKRRVAREARDEILYTIEREIVSALESTLTYVAAVASDAMVAALTDKDGGPGPWLASQRDPRDAREMRERAAKDAARAWIGRCGEIINELQGATRAAELVGEEGLRTMLASAALGIEDAHTALAILLAPSMAEPIAAAHAELEAARRYCINREALDVMKPIDAPSLAPDASSQVRLRRAELRGLL